MDKVNLLDICNPKQWKTLATSELIADGKYDVYGANGIIGKYDDYNHEKSTVLITCRGATCGNVHLSKPFSYINGNAMSLDNLDESRCLKEYLYYYLKGIDLSNSISGSAQPQITIQGLKKINVSLYDIKQQRQIVNILSKIENLITYKKDEIEKANQLIKSQFVEMFGDPNFNEKNWITGTVNDIGLCVAGATPSTAIKEYWENGTIPWLSSGEVNKGRIYETDTKISQKGYDNASTKLVPPKTVLIAMAGQGKTRGLSAITEIELCTNQSVCSIVNNDKVNPEYLLYFFKMQYLELRNASTSSEGRGGLNLKIIGNYKVMIPPIELQNKFAMIVEQIDKQKFEFEKSLKKLEELQASLMQEYFG